MFKWDGVRYAAANEAQFNRQRITKPRNIPRARIEERGRVGVHLWGVIYNDCPMLYRYQTRDRVMRYWYGMERVKRGVRRAARFQRVSSPRP